MSLTVHQLAERAETTPHAVRYYTRIGLLKPDRHPENGYKLFAYDDVRRLRFIRQAKALGFTLNEIADVLHDAEQGRSPCPRARGLIKRRIEENRRKLEKLAELQRRMEEALAAWERMPDGMPDGHTVCHLIESLAPEVGED